MKTLFTAGALALACLAASACTTAQVNQLPATITALGNAGCKGSITVGIGASTASGLSPGSAHFDNTFTGDCDPSRVQKPAVTPGAVAAPTTPTPAQ